MTNVIDFEIEHDFESTDKQGGFEPLPVMHARVWAETVEFPATKDGKGRQAAFVFEVQEPDQWKGKKWREWWTMLHPDGNNDKAYARGKGRFDKFCRAIQVVIEKGMNVDELLYKSFVVKIGQNEFNGRVNNQIEHFYYEDDQAKEPVPELGVIGDGTMQAKAAASKPANDNRPAAVQGGGAQAGGTPAKTPWGQKKAA
ncbi:MAG TPA: hypothetical protein PKD55_19680 [Bellilinea sp.]|nr:hypothetical protein [Bellilinea sp.]